MAEDQPLCQVEVRFVGSPPARQVARAAGVSDVATNYLTLRCLVCGSFQPFLEALRGHEVLALTSIPVLDDRQSSAPNRGNTSGHGASHGS